MVERRHEWMRFLDAHTLDEATAELTRRISQVDAVYDDLCALIPGLYNCPDSDVPSALAWARTSVAEAAGLLTQVKSRLEDCEREVAAS